LFSVYPGHVNKPGNYAVKMVNAVCDAVEMGRRMRAEKIEGVISWRYSMPIS